MRLPPKVVVVVFLIVALTPVVIFVGPTIAALAYMVWLTVPSSFGLGLRSEVMTVEVTLKEGGQVRQSRVSLKCREEERLREGLGSSMIRTHRAEYPWAIADFGDRKIAVLVGHLCPKMRAHELTADGQQERALTGGGGGSIPDVVLDPVPGYIEIRPSPEGPQAFLYTRQQSEAVSARVSMGGWGGARHERLEDLLQGSIRVVAGFPLSRSLVNGFEFPLSKNTQITPDVFLGRLEIDAPRTISSWLAKDVTIKNFFLGSQSVDGSYIFDIRYNEPGMVFSKNIGIEKVIVNGRNYKTVCVYMSCSIALVDIGMDDDLLLLAVVHP